MKNQPGLTAQKLTENINSPQELLHAAVLDKAIAQGKFEIASDILHDIGNAVVGFGSYLTRIKRSVDENNLQNLQNLAGFFVAQQAAISSAIGEDKSGAVISMLNNIVDAQQASQEEIQKSIAEQLKLISHIQEILNIQRQFVTGSGLQEMKTTNLRSVINDCIAMLLASIEKRAIKVTLDIPVEVPVIMGDRTKLMQVMLNILKNSIEAIPVNGVEKTISIQLYALDELLILEVRDSGLGFDATTAGRIFQRGFTTKTSGTGLGLNNCRAIIEGHAGTIDITSNGIGKGSLTKIQFKPV